MSPPRARLGNKFRNLPKKMGYNYKKCLSDTLRGIFSGDGRSRTAVQTTCREAFYTLILPLVVGRGMPEGGLSEAYPLGLDLL